MDCDQPRTCGYQNHWHPKMGIDLLGYNGIVNPSKSGHPLTFFRQPNNGFKDFLPYSPNDPGGRIAMSLPLPEEKFTHFLCDAKRATYASQDSRSRVTPILKGSHQLEFIQGPLFYRDIYYGGDFFIGQETVYYQENPLWGMCYAGGLNAGVDTAVTPGIYDFLGVALRDVPQHTPFRGPESLIQDDFEYTNHILGSIKRFSGVETIAYKAIPVYQLHYSGGLIRV